MHIQTKFPRLRQPVSLGDRVDGWQVCWLGGWDKCRAFFIVMLLKECAVRPVSCTCNQPQRTNYDGLFRWAS
jgi:hypothetical protein